MKIIPTSPVANPSAQNDYNKAQATRERAINALMGGPKQGEANSQPPQSVVQSQQQVSPEELGAIIPTPNIQETSAPEETPVIEREEPKTDPTLSSQFAKLARQERAIRAKAQEQNQAIKAKEDALAAREAAIQAQEQKYKTEYVPKSLGKQDPLKYLEDAGLTYDDVTQSYLNPQQTDPRILSHIAKLEEKLSVLEGKATEQETSYKAQQQQAYDSAIKQIRNDVTNLVKTNDNYETIRHTNSQKDVVDLIVQTYNESEGQELLTVEEAADLVEEHILEEAVKLSRLGKVNKRLQPAATAQAKSTPAATKPETGTQTQPQTKTLNNTMGSSRPLTAKERAVLAFKGELK